MRWDAAYNIRSSGKVDLIEQPKFKHLHRYRWLRIPDWNLPFDKLLSLGGRSEEIAQHAPDATWTVSQVNRRLAGYEIAEWRAMLPHGT